MTDSKDPFDPFATRGDRTIIRPNPGGRRAAPAPPAQPAAPPPGYPPQPHAPQPYPPAGDAWAQPSYPAAQQPQHPAWPQMATPPPPPPGQVVAPSLPEQVAQAPVRDMPVAPGDNPLLSAAGPILLLLGRLRVALAQASFNQLMEQVATAIQKFEKDVVEAGSAHWQQAKYVICATADDIVQNIPSQDRQLWTQYSMLARFFGERTGGLRFFEELDRAKQDPVVNYNLLELQHACLALGFQGVHRTSAGGQATLQGIQRNLYETLRRVKSRVNAELSPRWQGQDMAATVTPVRVPFWAMAALAGALLLAMFLTLRSLLTGGSAAVVDDMSRIFPTAEVSIERRQVQPVRPPAPPPPIRTTQLERIRAALATEIGEGKLGVEGTPTSIIVRVGSFVSFAPGRADALPIFKPLAESIAKTLEAEPGQIRVVGHSDSQPISNARFPSNHALSVARAKAVGDLIAAGLTDKSRIVVEGKGDTVPLATNDTIEGRARNRRVDISIPHSR